MFEQIIRKKFLTALQKVKYGSITVRLPDGEEQVFNGGQSGFSADITLNDMRVVLNAIIKGDVGFAADYRDGYWTTTDLKALLNFFLQNEEIFKQYGFGNFIFKQLSKLLYLTKRNNLKGSKKNIHVHYDLGNDFYRLWLDPSMTYSSAMFKYDTQDLTEAQHQKYDRLLSKIEKSNAKILEVGCGWGGFAERATLNGHAVKCITLSTEQANYARQRLQGKDADIVIEDYREQKGMYDYIVSIEMFEAVGESYWPIYFSKLKQLLKPGGKILLQTITIADNAFEEYKKSSDMIRTFIFPGGMLPSEHELNKQFKKVGLVCKEAYRFGKDYAITLSHWLTAFDRSQKQISELGFGSGFVRLWRFYLAACNAEFNAGRVNVVQMELHHAD